MFKAENILFIGDNLSTLKLKTDSSLALIESALINKKKVFWCESNDVVFFKDEIKIFKCIEISFVSISDLKFKECAEKNIPFSHFHACFIRKDPPFNEEYKNLCWILSTQNNVAVFNSPESLLSFHEKSLQWRAYSEGFITKKQIIPTCLTRNIDVLVKFLDEFSIENDSGFICKPWLGHGGNNVKLFKKKEILLEYVRDNLDINENERLKSENQELYLIQPFIKEIYIEGDRRVLIANGKVVCDFVRLPAQGKIASNLAQGGTAIIKPMSEEQNNICLSLAKFLKKKNIYFAGIDLIGSWVGEINITSPTGIRTYEELTGKNVSNEIFDYITG